MFERARFATLLLPLLASCRNEATAPEESGGHYSEPALPSPVSTSAGSAVPFGGTCYFCPLRPKHVTRRAGPPDIHRWNFTTSWPVTHRLVVKASSSADVHARVLVNGALAVRAEDLAGSVRASVAVDVPLQLANSVELELYGSPGESVTLWVEPIPLFEGGDGAAILVDPDAPQRFLLGIKGGFLLSAQATSSGTLLGWKVAGGDEVLATLGQNLLLESAYYRGNYYYFQDWRVNSGVPVATLKTPIGTAVEVSFPAQFAPLISSALTFAGGAVPPAFAAASSSGPIITVGKFSFTAAAAFECVKEVIWSQTLTKLTVACTDLAITLCGEALDFAGQPQLATYAGILGLLWDLGTCASGTDPWACITLPWKAALLVLDNAAPAAVYVVRGDGQSGPIGSALPIPLEVVVVNKDGFLLNGIVGEFGVSSGGGHWQNGKATDWILTDDGYASNSYTLGLIASTERLYFRTISFQKVGVTFSVVATNPYTAGLFRLNRGTPSIDGVIGVSEWANAVAYSIPVTVSGSGNTTATLLLMNDGANLYAALRLPSPTPGALLGRQVLLWLLFHDPARGPFPGQLSDVMLYSKYDSANPPGPVIGPGAFSDWAYRQPCPLQAAGYCGTADTRFGGTNDGGGAGYVDDQLYSLEMWHPLRSGDTLNDFQLSPGNVIGLFGELLVGGSAIDGSGTPHTIQTFPGQSPTELIGVQIR